MNLAARSKGSVLREAHPTHLLTAASGIILICFSLLTMTAVQKLEPNQHDQHLVEAAAVLAIAVTYVVCLKLTQSFEKRGMAADEVGQPVRRDFGLLVKIAVISLVTIASAWWLTQTGDVLAEHPIELIGRPLGKTFVGVCFLALATSLPEVTTSVAAVRMGNLNMALGNIFGSNMFNILVIPIVKLATWSTGDPVLMSGPDFNIARNIPAGLLPILMTGVALIALTYHTERRFMRLGFDSVLLLVVYVVGMLVVLGGGTL